jgi:hypothetical protein
VIDVPLTDNLTTCYVDVMVHPDHRREGVGAALYAEAERTVRGLGRSIIMGWSEEPVRGFSVHGSAGDDGGGALVPATGAGSYPRNAAPAAMALSRGFTLAQVDRCSVLDLARTPLSVRDAHDRAAAAAGPEYTVLQWAERCPDEYVDQYAQLRQAMSTDAPLGELALDEEAWDAERVRGDEARLREGGGRSLVSAALTGRRGPGRAHRPRIAGLPAGGRRTGGHPGAACPPRPSARNAPQDGEPAGCGNPLARAWSASTRGTPEENRPCSR